MSYKIHEAKIEFKDNKPVRVIVGVQISKGDFRAIEATNNPNTGYFHIMPDTPLNEELLQKVAAQGCQIFDAKKYPSGWIRKYCK